MDYKRILHITSISINNWYIYMFIMFKFRCLMLRFLETFYREVPAINLVYNLAHKRELQILWDSLSKLHHIFINRSLVWVCCCAYMLSYFCAFRFQTRRLLRVFPAYARQADLVVQRTCLLDAYAAVIAGRWHTRLYSIISFVI